MLGSRYLNPYFGSGIYTWAALISTVLAALTAGYFLGGWLADRTASAAVLGADRAGRPRSISWRCRASPKPLLDFVLADIDDVRAGSLRRIARHHVLSGHAARHLFAVRDPADAAVRRSARASVSGTVYGVSTAGSIVGTLGTTFFLIPLIGTRAITLSLGAAGIVCGLSCWRSASRTPQRRGVPWAAGAVAVRRPRARRRRAREEPDRPERARGDAQAQGRPHRPHRERVQRHLRQQAPRPSSP